MADKMMDEKRRLPRFEVDFYAEINQGNLIKAVPIQSRGVDLSEGGIRLSASNIVCREPHELLIKVKRRNLEVGLTGKLQWSCVDSQGNFSYGLSFLGGGSLALAKKILHTEKGFIKEQIKSIGNGSIGNSTGCVDVDTAIINFFLGDLIAYFENLLAIEKDMGGPHFQLPQLVNTVKQVSDEIVKTGDRLEAYLHDKLVTRKIKSKFRDLVGSWVFESKIMERAFQKPRGYPGDHQMLEFIYNNQPISKAIGFLFDEYFLGNPYATAVRSRKGMMRDVLRWFLDKNKDQRKLRILNVACGSCREIQELFAIYEIKSETVFTCVDQDEEALDFARAQLAKFESKYIRLHFLREDVLNFFKSPVHYRHLLGQQDLIYSIGLIDYLPDRILKKFVEFAYSVLDAKGILVLTHKDRDHQYKPIPADWFCDWVFYPRNEEELVSLVRDACQGQPPPSISVQREESNCIFFLTLTKPQ